MNNLESIPNNSAATIKSLKRQVQILTAFVALLFIAFLMGFKNNKEQNQDIIKTKGIIISDENGKDRILIGAPFPYSKDRIRTDFEKSKKAWAGRFGGKFDWYKNNKSITNKGNGMLILDENGYDRVAVGSPVPSSYIGRIAQEYGISVNDESGGERGGWGLLKGDGIDRMVLGMDHATGYEGATMAVLEDGSVDIRLNESNNINRIEIVNDKGKIAKWNKYPIQFVGVLLKDSSGAIIKKFDIVPDNK
jgi:hypothetical protein